jgi:hypothetical protein
MCVMRQNYTELADFVRFANSMSATANFHKVYYPIEHSLRTLSKKELGVVVDHLSTLQLEENTRLEKMNKRHYQYIFDSIQEWLKQATINQFEDISDDALLTGIMQNAQAFLEKEFIIEEIKNKEYDTFKTKLTQLLALHSGTDLHRKILTQINRADFSKIFPMFRQFSVDQLYKLTQKHLPDIS